MLVNAWLMRLIMNLYPPLRGAGIDVTHISSDFRKVEVKLALKWYNRNLFGTHYGGSLYGMTDPFYTLMLTRVLGRDYTVAHQGGKIKYMLATKETAVAKFEITDAMVEDIKLRTKDGNKYLPLFIADVKTVGGETIAVAEHTIYIRKRYGQAS